MQKQQQRSTYIFVLPWALQHPGGVNQVVINLAREMVKAGVFSPLVFITDWNAAYPICEEVYGLKTVRWRIRPYHASMGLKEKMVFFFWERRFRRRCRSFFRKYTVAAINIHYPGKSAFTITRIIEKSAIKIPIILSFHGADLSNISSSSIELAMWRRLVLRVNGVVVCSKDLGRKCVSVFGNKFTPQVIHNGLDAGTFVAMASSSTQTKERIILNVAKFENKKGQDVLINAFAAIASEYGDLRLVLVGASDKALPKLRKMCVEKGIESRVRFFSDVPHEQVATFFQTASIFVLPSRQEPFGIVLLEAGAFKLPVVASRVGGIPEIISDGINGWLVAPDNSSELASRLKSLIDNPIAANEMGSRLYQHVISNFSWTSAYNKYAALMQQW